MPNASSRKVLQDDLALWSASAEVAFRAEDIAIETRNPLASARRDVEIADGGLDAWRNALPIELRIQIREIGGRGVTELFIHPDLFEFIIQRIGFSQIMGVTQLSNEIGGPHKRTFFVILIIRLSARESGEFDGAGNPRGIQKLACCDAIHHEYL